LAGTIPRGTNFVKRKRNGQWENKKWLKKKGGGSPKRERYLTTVKRRARKSSHAFGKKKWNQLKSADKGRGGLQKVGREENKAKVYCELKRRAGNTKRGGGVIFQHKRNA